MTVRRFDERVAVITGGGRGLGRSYARLLAAKGARVVINDPGSMMDGSGTDAGAAAQVVRDIVAAGGEAVANTDSVATPEGGKAIIQAALDHYQRIDILIHSAGNVRYGGLGSISPEDFNAVRDVHLMGAFHTVREAFPLMCAAGYGRIVLTSSISGLYGTPNTVNYGVSKAGMIGLNNIIALEGGAKGVKGNIILPSALTRMADGLDTSQYPPLGAELVAPMVGWLAHESCSVNGEMLVAIGGRMARAFVTETAGVYRPTWTIDEVAEDIDGIRSTDELWYMSTLPYGFGDHLQKSFDMARNGGKA